MEHHAASWLVLTRDDDRFYPLIGPYLSRREVVSEIGAPIWDDHGKVWTVALATAGDVLAFGAVVTRPGGSELCSDYVVPSARRRGLYAELLARRLDCLTGRIRMTANANSLPAATAAGFVPTGQRGRFTRLETIRV